MSDKKQEAKSSHVVLRAEHLCDLTRLPMSEWMQRPPHMLHEVRVLRGSQAPAQGRYTYEDLTSLKFNPQVQVVNVELDDVIDITGDE